jgi:hypothetical protein
MPETHELPVVIEELGLEIDRALARADRIERLAAQSGGGTGGGIAQPTKKHRRARGRWALAGSVALATVAVAAVLLAGDLTSHGRSIGTDAALAEVAHRIELAPAPRADQFIYMKSRTVAASMMPGGLDLLARPVDAFVWTRSTENVSWLSISKPGRMSWRIGKPTYPTRADAKTGRQYWHAFELFQALQKRKHGRGELRDIMRKLVAHNRKTGLNGIMTPMSLGTETGTFESHDGVFIGGERLTPAQIKTFPRDPQQLYDRVRAGAEKDVTRQLALVKKFPRMTSEDLPDVDTMVWEALSNPFGAPSQPLPADLRAAMVRALGKIPGAIALGDRTDALGRTGPAFSWTHAGRREEVIFDHNTSVTISATTTIVDPSIVLPREFRHLPAGTKTFEFQLIDQKTVDRLPRRR